MAAPEHVPTKPAQPVRAYASPPRRPDTWRARRPADFAEDHRQPQGELLGNQGPDQGYALKLGRLLEPELHLTEGEHARDAVAGIVAIGLKRASLLGRAPVMHDLRIAATLFGFLDATADPELVRLRRELFEEVSHFHHYMELRRIVDMVPAELLRQTPEQVTQRHQASWRDQLDLQP
ncbi:MAG TPA: hypothetical protein VFU14_08960 [Acidimicrobiales bacterium]|nr:hypothetical protein [Acidimicrobiales bacterium]